MEIGESQRRPNPQKGGHVGLKQPCSKRNGAGGRLSTVFIPFRDDTTIIFHSLIKCGCLSCSMFYVRCKSSKAEKECLSIYQAVVKLAHRCRAKQSPQRTRLFSRDTAYREHDRRRHKMVTLTNLKTRVSMTGL